MERISFTILGQPCSKANSRQIVTINNRPKPIKSAEARAYERDALLQIPVAFRLRLEVRLRMTLHLFYRNELSDLDESIVLDVLQDRWAPREKAGMDGVRPERVLLQAGVYRNDRQVRERHVYHHIDKHNPRAEILIEPLQAVQAGLI